MTGQNDIHRLVKADNHIQKIVAEFGLDCFPQEFDVIMKNNARNMNIILFKY